MSDKDQQPQGSAMSRTGITFKGPIKGESMVVGGNSAVFLNNVQPGSEPTSSVQVATPRAPGPKRDTQITFEVGTETQKNYLFGDAFTMINYADQAAKLGGNGNDRPAAVTEPATNKVGAEQASGDRFAADTGSATEKKSAPVEHDARQAEGAGAEAYDPGKVQRDRENELKMVSNPEKRSSVEREAKAAWSSPEKEPDWGCDGY